MASLSKGESPVLSEIISRSLAHIQATSGLTARHHIGEHELCGPDYHFVCEIAKDLRLPPEEVLSRMLENKDEMFKTCIEDGRIIDLCLDGRRLPISSIPRIEGLVVRCLDLEYRGTISGFDFSIFPNLTKLAFDNNQLTELDLSQVPNLTRLLCSDNQLTELDLSHVPNLTGLWCNNNQLTELDIRNLPSLKYLMGNRGTTRLIHRPDQEWVV